MTAKLLVAATDTFRNYGKGGIVSILPEGADYGIKETLPNYVRLIISDATREEAHNYIDKWVRNQLLLEKAVLNLDQDRHEIRKQLEEYRTFLLINKYQQELILQKLDTIITIEARRAGGDISIVPDKAISVKRGEIKKMPVYIKILSSSKPATDSIDITLTSENGEVHSITRPAPFIIPEAR